MKNIRLLIFVLLLAPILTLTYCGGGSGGGGDKVDLTNNPSDDNPSSPGGNKPGKNKPGKDNPGTPDDPEPKQIPVEISGSILDESGSTVSGAIITVKDSDGNIILQITSDSNGNYSYSSTVSEDATPATVTISSNGYSAETVSVSSISEIQDAINGVKLDKADLTYYSFTTNVKDNTSGTASPIEGAVIKIKDSNGTIIAKFPKTDSSGNSSFTGYISDVSGSVTAYIDFEYVKNGETKTYTYTVSADSLADLITKLKTGVAVIRNVVDGTPAKDDDNNPPSTVQKVAFDVYIKNQETGETIPGAVLQIVKVTDVVKNADGVITSFNETTEVITSLISNENGKIDGTIPINTAEGYVSIIVKANGYEDAKPSICQDISGLELIDGQIVLKKLTVPTGVDNDGDGILAPNEGTDVDDNDPNIAIINTASYVFAFEDMYSKGRDKGDADFNDLIVKVTYKQYVNSDGKTTKIDIITKPLASGAGYTDSFVIRISGKDYVIYDDFYQPFKDSGYKGANWKCNTGTGYSYIDVPEKTTTIEFPEGVSAKDLGSMPFDPFIIPKNDRRGQGEVHIPAFNTTYTGALVDRDNFPWAIVIPEDWKWPYESVEGKIYAAYPQFRSWYESKGNANKDWYLYPDKDYVFKR
ncbi:MAG: LruC domain-containing protein [Spirochaetes bacterium]|nr:LruC domain-containing protein [Spirochaetota bacterium]